jgi:hypothetical protein
MWVSTTLSSLLNDPAAVCPTAQWPGFLPNCVDGSAYQLKIFMP